MNQTPSKPTLSEQEPLSNGSESAGDGARRPTEQERLQERCHALRFCVFVGAMLLCFVLGLLFFLRPERSESEKRELTDFPSFSWETLLSGEYFNGISTWYADTFPGREGLIRFNQSIRELFGIRTVQLIQTTPPADDGDTGTPPADGENPPVDNRPIEQLGGVYVKGETAYEVYRQNATNSSRYAELIALAAEQLQGVAEVYAIAVPLSSSVNLSESEQRLIGGSDAAAAIASMYAAMEGVRTVNVLPTLIDHNGEYLYFRTDHHWTARGAYYAYVCFCEAAGMTPYALSDWQKYEFEGFLGTLYDEADRPQSLGRTPDTVEAWVPNGTNAAYVTDKSGKRLYYSNNGVVRTDTDAFYQAAASKYNCFLMGDSPLVEIHNERISDGSAIVLVKESFGNALAPFLVDHYEYVYVVDYRYFTDATGQTLPGFVRSVGAERVLFVNNLTATSASARLRELSRLLGVQ